MIRHKCLKASALLSLVVLVAGSASAFAEKKMSWKYNQGDKLSYTLKREGVDDAGSGKFTHSCEYDVTITIGDVSDSGDASATVVVERAQIKLDDGMSFLDYDSQKGATADSRRVASTAVVVGKEIKVTLMANGSFKDIKGSDEVEAAWKAENVRPTGFWPLTLTKAGVERILINIFIPLTGKTPQEGETWENKIDGPMEARKEKQSQTTKYTHDGVRVMNGTEVELLKLESTLAWEFGKDATIRLELKKQESEGSAMFDAAQGRLLHLTLTMKREAAVTSGDNMFDMNSTEKVTVEMK